MTFLSPNVHRYTEKCRVKILQFHFDLAVFIILHIISHGDSSDSESWEGISKEETCCGKVA